MGIEIRPKNENKRRKDGEKEKVFGDKYDIYKHMMEVHSEINDNIRADYPLAYLKEQDREGVINMTSNAYITLDMYRTFANMIRKDRWNNKEKRWEEEELTEEEKKIITTNAKESFQTLMTKVHMTVLMNRNVKENPTLKGVFGDNIDRNEDEEAETEEKDKIKEGTKKVLSVRDEKD